MILNNSRLPLPGNPVRFVIFRSGVLVLHKTVATGISRVRCILLRCVVSHC